MGAAGTKLVLAVLVHPFTDFAGFLDEITNEPARDTCKVQNFLISQLKCTEFTRGPSSFQDLILARFGSSSIDNDDLCINNLLMLKR